METNTTLVLCVQKQILSPGPGVKQKQIQLWNCTNTITAFQRELRFNILKLKFHISTLNNLMPLSTSVDWWRFHKILVHLDFPYSAWKLVSIHSKLNCFLHEGKFEKSLQNSQFDMMLRNCALVVVRASGLLHLCGIL